MTTTKAQVMDLILSFFMDDSTINEYIDDQVGKALPELAGKTEMSELEETAWSATETSVRASMLGQVITSLYHFED